MREKHENYKKESVLHADINELWGAIYAGRWFLRGFLNILLMFFSVAAVKVSLLTNISIVDRGGGLSRSESWRGGVGDFHRTPVHLWVITVTSEEFPSLNTTFRQNVHNLKCTCRRMSPALFPNFAEGLCIVPLKRFDAQACT